MSYKLATAFIDIQAKTTGLTASFGHVRNALGEMLARLQNINPILAAVAGLGSMAFAVRQLMAESEQGALVNARLTAIIRATGDAARVSKEEVLDYAAELQRRGTFGDTEIAGATARLLQMRAVTRDTFKDVLELSTDVARAGFGSVEHAATTLGRALADPASGLRRLRAIGIVFTKDEQEKIAALAKGNQLLAAQKAILDKVRNSVGGLDAEFAKTPQGMWTQAKNDLASISQELGNHLYPVVAKLAKEFVVIVRPIAKFLGLLLDINEELGGWPLKLIILGTATKIAAGYFGIFRESILKTTTQIVSMAGAMKTLWYGRMVPVMGGMLQMPGLIARIGLAWKALVAAITTGTLLTGWGGILVAIGAILAGAVALYAYVRQFPKFNEAWERTLIAVRMAFETVLDLIYEIGAAIDPLLKSITGWGIVDMIEFLREGIPNAAAYMANEMTRQLAIVITWVRVLRNHLADVGNLMVGIATRDLKKIAVAVGSMSDIGREAGIEFQSVLAEIARRQSKAKADRAALGLPDVASPTSAIESKTGLIGLQDAWKSVQESLLKKDDPQERMATGIEGIEATSRKQLEEQLKTNQILAAGGAVAMP